MILPLLAALATAAPCALVPVQPSPPDGEGRIQLRFDLPSTDRPAPLSGHYDRTFCVPIPQGYRIVKVRSFIGFDAGTTAEAALDFVVGGQTLHARSVHKETRGIYDAWDSETTSYLIGEPGMLAYLFIRAWPTGGPPSNIEVGVVVDLVPVGLR